MARRRNGLSAHPGVPQAIMPKFAARILCACGERRSALRLAGTHWQSLLAVCEGLCTGPNVAFCTLDRLHTKIAAERPKPPHT